MKIYEFKSPTCIITLETTTTKDKDYFEGTYRVSKKIKRDQIIFVKLFDFNTDAKKCFLNLVNDWVLC